MQYTKLGHNGPTVSRLCLGTMTFGAATPQDQAAAIMDRALDAGMNFFDTANVYVKGVSEEIVGRHLAQDGKRDRVVLATKVSAGPPTPPNNTGGSRLHIMSQVEKSLRRLRTDHIDIYYLHRMDLETPLAETLRTLDDLVRQGKILYPACSKFAPSRIAEAMLLCERYGWAPFVCEQPPYNLLDRSLENEMIFTCRRFGMGICPWGPVAQGLLSGKYAPGVTPPAGSRWDGKATNMFMGDRFTPQAMTTADRFKPLAQEKGVTLAQFALAWVAQQPGITSPILGTRTLEHLEGGLQALDLTLTAEDRRRVDEIVPPGSAACNFLDAVMFRPLRTALGLG